MVLIAVAGGALQRRVLELQRVMAFLARHSGVPTDERKSSDVMIEGRDAAPIVLAMAFLAPNAELTLVPVILAMTRHACCRKLFAIEIAGVTAITLDLGMRTLEREFCVFVVIEEYLGPFILFVAGFTFGAVAAEVNVLNGVAIGAPGADPLVKLADMARGAGNTAVRTFQRELGLVVVERLNARP